MIGTWYEAAKVPSAPVVTLGMSVGVPEGSVTVTVTGSLVAGWPSTMMLPEIATWSPCL